MEKIPWFVWFVALLILGLIIGFTNLFLLVVLSLLAPCFVKYLIGVVRLGSKSDTKPDDESNLE